MVSKRTNTNLVKDMIRRDLREVARSVVATCKEQWDQRKSYQEITAEFPCLKKKNGLRGVPDDWSKLVNTMVKPCPACRKKGEVTSRWHLLTKHNIRLPHVNYIWRQEILPITEEETEERRVGLIGEYIRKRLRKRKDIKDMTKPIIARHLQNYDMAWGNLLVQAEGH